MNLSNNNTSFTNTSFGPYIPKNSKPIHSKKQAPLSLITNPNAVFVKTKIGDIASFYKEASLKINHNKKASLVLHGLKPKPSIHSKHKTNIISDLSIHLNSTLNNKTHDIINPNNSKHINTHIHNKTHIPTYIKTKPKHSAVSVCKDKQIVHKKINSTFQVVSHNLNKNKGANYNASTLRHSSCKKEHDNGNVNKTMINQHVKRNKIKNCKALSKQIINKVAKQGQPNGNNKIKTKGLEIKINCDLNEDVFHINNNGNKSKGMQKQIPSSTRGIPLDKIGIMNQHTKQSSRMKTESNDFSACNKIDNRNANTNNNNFFSIQNKPKDKKYPPKRPNKLSKCPFKLNLLDIINENTKNSNTLPSNYKSLTKRTRKHKNKSISTVHNHLNNNNNITYDTMESVLDEQFTKKNIMNTSTYEDEENEYGDLNSIVKKINFKVVKDNIFSTESNNVYDSYCKKFESRYENAFNYKHDNNKTHMYRRVSNSGSTCDNSSKKYHVTKGMVNKL